MRNDQRSGLPAWTYNNPELLELEKDTLFRRCWQLVGHASDIPNPGDFLTLDLVGERALAIRGNDGLVRCFHNVCRHRGSRVVAGAAGRCRGSVVCPFHGWSYQLDGRLQAVSKPQFLPDLDPARHGLVPLEFEIWLGFIFVRFQSGRQDSVGRIMSVYGDEVSTYRLEELAPLRGFSSMEIPVNWKAVRDVDNEGYHVPVAHPLLQDLYGQHYADGSSSFGTSRSFARFNNGPGHNWSVRHYKKILPVVSHLKEDSQMAWMYIGMYPNLVLSFYPDQVGFYQEYPVAIDRTVQRSAYYAVPDARREMKLARYLSSRIDRVAAREDARLIQWSWEATQSSAYTGVILSDLEEGVRAYHDWLRYMIPVFNSTEEPAPGNVTRVNSGTVSLVRGKEAGGV